MVMIHIVTLNKHHFNTKYVVDTAINIFGAKLFAILIIPTTL